MMTSDVAQADPCNRSEVATEAAAGLGAGALMVLGLSRTPGIGNILRNPYVAAIATGASTGTWYGSELMKTTWAGDNLTAGQAWQILFEDFVFRPIYSVEERKAIVQ